MLNAVRNRMTDLAYFSQCITRHNHQRARWGEIASVECERASPRGRCVVIRTIFCRRYAGSRLLARRRPSAFAASGCWM
jgi:hypothetical protein